MKTTNKNRMMLIARLIDEIVIDEPEGTYVTMLVDNRFADGATGPMWYIHQGKTAASEEYKLVVEHSQQRCVQTALTLANPQTGGE